MTPPPKSRQLGALLLLAALVVGAAGAGDRPTVHTVSSCGQQCSVCRGGAGGRALGRRALSPLLWPEIQAADPLAALLPACRSSQLSVSMLPEAGLSGAGQQSWLGGGARRLCQCLPEESVCCAQPIAGKDYFTWQSLGASAGRPWLLLLDALHAAHRAGGPAVR